MNNMSWFRWITKVNPQKVFDTVANGIDKLAFTKEEKADFNKEMIKAQSEFVKNTLAESSVRSRTRRFIAKSIVILVIGLTVAAAIAWPFYNEYSNFLFKVIDSYKVVFLTVCSFYFGSAIIRTVTKNKD
jgi:sterol desaturase/sphingolipid hydroxylase (fatty acid hydroxylase superfamily)